LAYDTRDNRLNPTSGFFAEGSVEFAGLGGSERFVIFTGRSAYYYPLSPRWIVSFSGRFSHIEGLGKRVPLTERFFLGGSSFRGFDFAGIGPRDGGTGDALGAETVYVLTAEVEFPLGLPPELGIRGRAWVDFGSAFGIDFNSPRLQNTSAPRMSAGVGISWASPLGPLRFDLGFPIITRSGDETRIFNFQFGTRF
jgi:outer membrane protein insertion porin family